MESLIRIIPILCIICGVYFFYQLSLSTLNIIRLKGTPQYRAWRRRNGQLKTIDKIEKTIAIFLIITTLVIIILFLLWGKNN